jgi:class 3 adenylate cyclase
MSLGVGAQSLRQNLYQQVAVIVQNPQATALEPALHSIRACLQAGEPLLASQACESLAQVHPEHPPLLQQWALALARSGAASKANQLMRQLAARGLRDEETLGLLARTHKDLWLQSGDAQQLQQALVTYRQAYDGSHGIWSGINAATLALVQGDTVQAQQLAQQVLQALEPLLQPFRAGAADADAAGADYWDYATLGEAALILDQHELLVWAYRNALRVSPGQLGNRASSLRNAELVLLRNSAARQFVEQFFQLPQLVIFSGHMLDSSQRKTPRFVPQAEPVVYQRILDTLRRWEVQVGFASASGGADLLFLEALRELGAETNIVLPHPPQQFIQTSVAQAAGSDWIARFERALANARQVTILSDSVGDELTYQFTGIVLAGLATLRATQLYGRLRGLTVWDLDTGYVGGTGSTVSDWLRRGVPVARFSPRIEEPELTTLTPAQGFGGAEELMRSRRQKIIGMLFADAVGFSKLAESQIPLFVERFLGGVRTVMDRQGQAPLTSNTWGDGLYFTFDAVMQASEFALALSDFVNATDWAAQGLPPDMSLRIALHAGPAFEVTDPVTQRVGFTGSHVSRAARIEPVTPPGTVYCSEAFAALVALEQDAAYHCEFVGNLPFAKNFGVFPTYSLKRRAKIS